MKTTIKSLSFLALILALTVGCASRGDEPGDDDPTPDGGTDLTVDPPAESATWPCRSGVDAEGQDYMEFNPRYLGNEAQAYIVGQASSEGIGGYFHGNYVQVSKHEKSGWYRLDLTGGADPSELTYAKCVDMDGGNAACWAQYGTNSLSDSSAGAYRWCQTTGSCACRFTRSEGEPATPNGN